MRIRLKPNLLFLIISLSLCTTSFAQVKNTPDTSFLNIKVDTTSADNALDTIPVVSLDGDDAQDGRVQSISSSGRGWDVFSRAAVFSFSPVRFAARGYGRDNSTTYMNGVQMEDLTSGYATTSLWAGLGDETRNRYTTLGLHNNPFTFGEIGSSTFIDTRASKQRKQTSISFARTDGYLKDATAITHSTGMSKKGWAFTFSGDRRYSDNGYIPGTYYNGWGYFVGVDKKLNSKQLLSLVVFGAPSESGGQGRATKETFGLAGTNYYNPGWGYQNGKVRSARVNKTNQPTAILSHDFSINKSTSLLTAASFTSGERSYTRLDYFDAPNPEADYYTYLPSYQLSPALAQQITDYDKANPSALQLNWNNFYKINRQNYDTLQNVDGVAGKTVGGHRSLYVLGENVTKTNNFNFNTTLNKLITSDITLTAGLSYQMQKNNYFKRISDLLGGDFFVNVDQYAQQDFPNNPNASQNNLNDPNQILHVGDKYGYNYDINVNQAQAWVQSSVHKKNVDFFVALQLSNTSFWRTGHYVNGLFPDSSFGKSSVNNFTNYAVKAGISYKIQRGNYLYLNAAYLTKAPYFQDAYLDAEIKSSTQTNLRSQDIQTVEGGYVMNSPLLNLRVTGYYSLFEHGFNVSRYFDYPLNEYIDYALSNINTVQFGGELGAEARILKGLTVEGVASVGRYYYNSRQFVTITQDNSNANLPGGIVYTQNYRLPNTPQEAYSLGLNYRSRQYWYVSLNGSYFDQMWADIIPDRRTSLAVQGVDPKTTLYSNVLDQEKFPGEYLVNLRAGKSWKLGNIAGIRKTYILALTAGINNLLNNQNIISSGREGARDVKLPNGVFDTKYTYADGRTYFIKATLRFY